MPLPPVLPLSHFSFCLFTGLLLLHHPPSIFLLWVLAMISMMRTDACPPSSLFFFFGASTISRKPLSPKASLEGRSIIIEVSGIPYHIYSWPLRRCFRTSCTKQSIPGMSIPITLAFRPTLPPHPPEGRHPTRYSPPSPFSPPE